MRKYLWGMAVLMLTFLQAGYRYHITPLPASVKSRMIKGHSWHKQCPVGLNDLRYVQLSYHDFNGKDQRGELIVHKDVAEDIVHIFGKLYRTKYPVRSMRLVSDFGGSDWKSIEADNTSAFNCRQATGSKHWSKHAYGKAIDINPIENPYISRGGRISHKASQKCRKRVHGNCKEAMDRALLLRDDRVTEIFKKYGWRWGGEWSGAKDYQHFYKP